MPLSEATIEEVRSLQAELRGRLADCATVEQGAAALLAVLCGRYAAEIVLARVFLVAPLGELPREVQAFARRVAAQQRQDDHLNDQTPVLALLATRGVEPAWNDRRNSQGHLGIPLTSHGFVANIPMVARLLRELGVNTAELLDAKDEPIVRRSIGSLSGLFYVEDARASEDKQGRRIIADQDFAALYDVRSAFGFGGAYLQQRHFAVTVIFTSEPVSREVAGLFTPLGSLLKTGTMRLVASGRLFDGDHG